MTLTEVLIFGFAVWRLTQLLIYEDGPANVVGIFRAWIFGYQSTIKPGSIQYVFTCFSCMSVWSATFFLALWAWAPVAASVAAGVFCLSGVAFLLEKVIERLEVIGVDPPSSDEVEPPNDA